MKRPMSPEGRLALTSRKKDSGELSVAFLNNDHEKVVQLTKNLPPSAKRNLRSIVEVYKQRRQQGMTPLIAAILHHNYTLCDMLIEEGVDMGQDMEKGFNKLFNEENVIKMHNDALVQILAGPGVDHFKDFDKTTPMFWAVKSNSPPALIQKLITGGFQKDLFVEKMRGMTALMLAVLDNNMGAVRVLLKNFVDVHATDFTGQVFPLELAIERKYSDMVRILLKHGEDPNCKRHLKSPLIHAILNSNVTIVEVLTDEGADIQLGWCDKTRIRPLQLAINFYYFDIAVFLISLGADVNARTDENGATALHRLTQLKEQDKEENVASSKVAITKILVKKGAEVNAKNIAEETALFGAINSMNVEVVRCLLVAGAHVNIKNIHGLSPLLAAVIPSNAAEALLLTTPQSKVTHDNRGGVLRNTPSCIVKNQLEIVKLLIKAGADINSKDSNGHSPLFVAVIKNNFEIVNLLLDAGAEANVNNNDGMPLLCCAVGLSNINIVRLLTDKVADVNVCNKEGVASIHIAVDSKRCDVVEHLLEVGADVNAEDFFKRTPLAIAIFKQHYKTIKLLVKAGANINAKDNDGRSFLHFAAQNCNLKLGKLLLEAGADCNAKDKNGVTPFELGIFELGFDCEFVKLFLDYGTDVTNTCESDLITFIICRHEPELLKILWRHNFPSDETGPQMDMSRSDFKSEVLYAIKTYQISKTNILCANICENEEEKLLLSAQKNFLDGIKDNKLDLVLDALAKGAEPRGCSKTIPFPLHYVVKQGYHEISKVLLSKGVPANTLDEKGETPLHVAAREGNLQSCSLLLQYGACYTSILCKQPQQMTQQFPVLVQRCQKITHQLQEPTPQHQEITQQPPELTVVVQERLQLTQECKQLVQEHHQMPQEYQQLVQKHQQMTRQDQKLDQQHLKETQLFQLRQPCQQFSHQQLCQKHQQLTQQHPPLQRLFQKIKRAFRSVRQGHSDVLETLRKCLADKDWELYQILVNCVDNKGRTLMALAVHRGHSDIADALMKFRIGMTDLD